MNATEASAVFRALGDPTRLEVLRLLGDGEGDGATATALAERLPITRQGVSKHIAVLTEAGLIASEPQGRAVIYRLRADVLAEAAGWLERAGATWDARLDRLRDHLERTRG
ncbi:MAG: metalloregulator ArsR/SmtB family transcription factor [Chloroflexi bacterium]|nr:metalloregulator ArsR/SmtB family transcription factor [Chloroflexota bacterium]MDA1145136.1 metalloregulator ArsR/SmtB family transcription factor [Chloroflexota bacterium]